jgi:hypothetical protein
MCREWQKPPGREHEHHPICVNKASWESQQAHDPDAPRDRVVVSTSAAHAGANEASAPPEPLSPVAPASQVEAAQQETEQLLTSATPKPETCICQTWAEVSAGHHHALCQFRNQWDRENAVSVPQLIELETGVVAREASAEEAAASKRKEPEDGVGAIELSDGKLYYVRAG